MDSPRQEQSSVNELEYADILARVMMRNRTAERIYNTHVNKAKEAHNQPETAIVRKEQEQDREKSTTQEAEHPKRPEHCIPTTSTPTTHPQLQPATHTKQSPSQKRKSENDSPLKPEANKKARTNASTGAPKQASSLTHGEVATQYHHDRIYAKYVPLDQFLSTLPAHFWTSEDPQAFSRAEFDRCMTKPTLEKQLHASTETGPGRGGESSTKSTAQSSSRSKETLPSQSSTVEDPRMGTLSDAVIDARAVLQHMRDSVIELRGKAAEFQQQAERLERDIVKMERKMGEIEEGAGLPGLAWEE
ncbi:uncharacterized protein EI97DRAFT_437666 [Westerdykella ornata]|uniref:Uncharacterized protein n=1 Tax=Westerdykella ornata TaxID=318751 RepID=A0A6A6J5B8_WESOR|nr:uncharacterized protein EI97DRAFT_437666 [Westerdykella ornata]KAF2271635.1 hypothetical protein EI97DRAFT_437666 [Westerdykella ornata]